MKVVRCTHIDRKHRERGFSLIELMVVLVIALVLSAMAAPQVLNAVNQFKLRNATVELSGIIQQARSRSVQDNAHYPVYFDTSSTAMTRVFVGIQGSTIDLNGKDPIVSWGPEIRPQAAANAPSTGALKTAFLQSGSASATVYDGNTNQITFGPMGVPCYITSSVCNSTTTPVAYWVFLQDSRTTNWEAVTITPAGKVQKWAYASSTWSLL
jgi:prepilin-type N-terminal cleavage/methylation domain-containing protein